MNYSLYKKLCFVCIGYLSGSVLYAPLFGKLLCRRDITENSKDQNPGTANAFLQGGFLCGVLSLICELAKGFLPVYLYLKTGAEPDLWLALMIAAPVAGHIFPLLRHFRGGIGIAVSFGSLLGLYPYLSPVLTLAACYIIFSVIFVIQPHYYRTLITYLVVSLLTPIFVSPLWIRLGMVGIAALIAVKLLSNKTETERCKVKLLWKS